MKLIIAPILLFLSFSISAQISPVVEDLRDRVPELPQTFPGQITIDPTRPLSPLPPAPPTITSTTPPSTIDGLGERRVYFVHGFGGTRDKWTRVMTASEFVEENEQGFQARQLEAIAVDAYQQNGSMLAAVNDVGGFINDNAELMPDSVRRQNFIIGHSQGGIVGRFLVTQDFCTNNPQAKDSYYGLVTFGSALNGAQIMNSRDENLIHDLGNDVCQVLTQEIITDSPLLHFIIQIIDGDGNENGVAMTLCDFFEDKILPAVFSKLETSIALDYRVGAKEVDRANSCLAPEVHKIAFYGVEPYDFVGEAMFPNPIFYRTVQHFFQDVNAHGNWAANNDNKLADSTSLAAMELFIQAQQHQQNAENWQEARNFLPYPLFLGANFFMNQQIEKAEAKMNLNRMYYDINDRWMAIIGATGIDTIEINSNSGTSCTCYVYDDTAIPYDVPAATPSECVHPVATDCTFSYNQPNSETITVSFENLESDGVVLAKSAQHMTGATYGSQRLQLHFPQDENEVDSGASHMQMRNDRNIRDNLRKLYSGDLDPWFETPIR